MLHWKGILGNLYRQKAVSPPQKVFSRLQKVLEETAQGSYTLDGQSTQKGVSQKVVA